MGIVNVFLSFCLIASICVHADLEDELDPNTGIGSVEQVFRGRIVKRESMGDPYEGCKTTKICFGGVAGCEQEKNCKYMTSVQKSGDNYLFRLTYNNATSDRPGLSKYVGVGITENGKDMLDVVMIDCHNNPPVSSANIDKSWSIGPTAKKIFSFPEEIIVDEPKTLSSDDGVLDCQFALKPSFTVTHAGKVNSFDLNTKKYKILNAVGRYDPLNTKGDVGGMKGTKMLYHTGTDRRSSALIDLQDPTKDPTQGPTGPPSDKTDASGALYLLSSFSIIGLVFKCIIILSMNIS